MEISQWNNCAQEIYTNMYKDMEVHTAQTDDVRSHKMRIEKTAMAFANADVPGDIYKSSFFGRVSDQTCFGQV
jgi:hypothetical protein